MEKGCGNFFKKSTLAAGRRAGVGQMPNGFSPDEASYGYNGYSLLHTGRDRFGEWLPLFSDNFGDLISASYMWLTVPSIALLGLNEFAVRLPAALVGITTVWVLYKLGAAFYDERVGLLAALFLAISPWHMQVSRYAEGSPLLPLFFCAGDSELATSCCGLRSALCFVCIPTPRRGSLCRSFSPALPCFILSRS